MDGWVDQRINGWVDGWISGSVDGWMTGLSRQMDGCVGRWQVDG